MSALKQLCQGFVARAENIGLKGRKRDDALMEYMIGAATLAQIQDDIETRDHILTVTAIVFSTRGFTECKRIAEAE